MADRLHLVPRQGTSNTPLPGRRRWLKRTSNEIEISQVFKRVRPCTISICSVFVIIWGEGGRAYNNNQNK
jgi:hypothetical protein